MVFFYHGAHGKPTVEPIRRFSGGRDFIVVGMPYIRDEPAVATPADYEACVNAECANYHRARAVVADMAAIDDRRVFIGAVSRGG